MLDLTPHCRAVLGRRAEGPWLRLAAPVSFWGGVDPLTGRIIDATHPQHGADITGRIVFSPGLKGSTAGPGALLEAIAAGHAPAALICPAPELVPVAACLAAESLGYAPPVLAQALAGPGEAFRAIEPGAAVRVTFEG